MIARMDDSKDVWMCDDQIIAKIIAKVIIL